MLRLASSAFALLLVATGAHAQSIGEPIPGRGTVKERANPARADARPMRPCPEYGPGFVRVDGSSFCVRAGGSVRVDVGKTTGALVQLEGRGPSSVGEVRTVVRMRGQVDRGLESGSYIYR